MLEVLADVLDHQFQGLGIGQVGLGHGDDCVTDTEVRENLQMLLGLRHPAVIGGNDKQCQVNGADAGDHVLDEVLVAGHINDTDPQGDIGRRKFERGEPQVDGQAARLLLRQAVCVGAGERLDKGGLAVIDMTGSGNDKVRVTPHQSGRRLKEYSGTTSTVRRPPCSTTGQATPLNGAAAGAEW